MVSDKKILSCFSLYKSKEEDKDQESMQSSPTLDPGYRWESDNVINSTLQTRAKRSALSKQVISKFI